MKDLIIIRIDELVQEIGALLEHREGLSSQINDISMDITAKQCAIIEFKRVIEASEAKLED